VKLLFKAEYWRQADWRFAFLLALVLLILPLGSRSLSNLALLLLSLHCLVFFRRADWAYALKQPFFWASAGFWALYALSLFWSDDMAKAWQQLGTKASFLLGPLLALPAYRRAGEQGRAWLGGGFVLGLILAALWALSSAGWQAWQAGSWYQEVTMENGETGRRYFFLYTHLAEPVMHPAYFGLHLGLGLLFLLNRVRHSRGANRFRVYAILGFFLLLLVLLQSRMTLLALILVLILILFRYLWLRFKWLSLLPAMVMALGLALLFSFASVESRNRYLQVPDFHYNISGQDFNSATYRLAEWHCALDALGENPWFGAGIGDAKAELLESYRRNQFWEGLRLRYNAHNQLLETALALGLSGVLALLLLLFLPAYRFWTRNYLLGLWSLVFLFLCLLTESLFERAWAVLLFNAYFPYLWSSAPASNDAV